MHKPGEITLIFEFGMLERMCLAGATSSLIKLGYRVVLVTREQLEALTAKKEVECWLVFGSIAFVRRAQKLLHHQPLAYYSDTRFYYSRYAHKLPEGVMLNDEAVFMPCQSLVRNISLIESLFASTGVFIRPDSGAKPFAGQCFDYQSLALEIEKFKQITSLTSDTMVMVSGLKVIESEYRFFIVEGKVVGESGYAHDDDQPQAVTQGARLQAQRIAEHAWQIDVAYTCDVVKTSNGYRVVELNAGSTSGFYHSDAVTIILAMAESAWREYSGDISISD